MVDADGLLSRCLLCDTEKHTLIPCVIKVVSRPVTTEKCLLTHISHLRVVWFIFFPMLEFALIFYSANKVDPDQTPLSSASDLGLHCLYRSQLSDARHKSFKWQLMHVCICLFILHALISVLYPFLLVSGVSCGLWLRHSLDFSY